LLETPTSYGIGAKVVPLPRLCTLADTLAMTVMVASCGASMGVGVMNGRGVV
jgi:hypothetical protein